LTSRRAAVVGVEVWGVSPDGAATGAELGVEKNAPYISPGCISLTFGIIISVHQESHV
jgi:hypothetical protein